MDIKNKLKQETPFGIILKAISCIRSIFNYICLVLLCRKVGTKVKVTHLPVIAGGRNISIGNNVFIGRNVHLIASGDSSIIIGDNVEIRDNVRLYAKNIIIEQGATLGEYAFLVGSIHVRRDCWISRYCDIAGEVEIGKAILGPRVACLSSDHARCSNGAILMNEPGRSGKVVIEDGAWIGMNATILKSVIVKRNAVVGAGSIVTKTVPEGAVHAGVPAKEIKSSL